MGHLLGYHEKLDGSWQKKRYATENVQTNICGEGKPVQKPLYSFVIIKVTFLSIQEYLVEIVMSKQKEMLFVLVNDCDLCIDV